MLKKNTLNFGIITLFYKNYNYGGVLQAYATIYFLQSIGAKAEQIAYDQQLTIKDRICEKGCVGTLKSIIQNTGKYLKEQTKKKKYIKSKQFEIEKKLHTRRYKFDKFMKRVGYSGPYTNGTIKKTLSIYSGFIAGSDQVWNPKWRRSVYYLDFVPKEIPKIAYAASIGKNILTQEEKNYIFPRIKNFQYISVREKENQKLLKLQTDKNIKVVVDPTLLLKQEDWDEIATESDVKDPYIFVYLLGNNKEHRTKIKQIGKMLNLKIVFLPHIHFQYEPADEDFADIDLYDVGPAEFVGLIKDAAIVATDSFHGCIFSIIYHKKFWAMKRHKDTEKENMNSRLYTLFGNLGLEDRLLDDAQQLTREKLLKEINYEAVDEKLEVLRKDSMDFLENALSESVKMIEKNQRNKGTEALEN